MNNLYSISHQLLTLGSDGSPVYLDQLSRLNRDVYEQALQLYNTHGDTPEAEGELCLGLLLAFIATVYDNGRKRQYIQQVLHRSLAVLPQLSPSLLKVRLLTYCYSEVYDEALLAEARSIIASWDKAALTLEQVEIRDELEAIAQSPCMWETVD